MKIVTEIEIADAIEKNFNIIDQRGYSIPLKANAVQLAFESKVGKKNIVMKTRQVGFTTWCVARHMLFCLTRPNTHSVGVFYHMHQSEYAYKMATKMLATCGENIKSMSNGSVYTAVNHYEIKKLSKKVRGADNLHISDLAWWTDEGRLADIRKCATPECEEILESTPQGSKGAFRDEWNSAPEKGVVQHFFPWWMRPMYSSHKAADKDSLTDEECGLIVRHGLTLNQIEWRRVRRLGASRVGELESFNESYLEKVPWL